MQNNSETETIRLGGGVSEDTYGALRDREDIYEDVGIDPLQDQPGRSRRSAAAEPEGMQEPEVYPATEDRTAIYHKVQQYKETWPDSCRLVDVNSLQFMSDEALDRYLSDVRFAVSSRRGSSLVGKGVDMAIVGLECVGKTYYPQLEGLHQDLSLNPEYQDILKELSIEYGSLKYVLPEYRLIMLVSGAAASRIMAPPPGAGAKPKPAGGDFVDAKKADKYAEL